MVVEVVLHTLDDLVILVSLACDEYYVARLSQRAGRPDGFPTVNYAEDAVPLACIEACQHIVNYLLRLFKAGVVTRNDDAVAVLEGFLSHEWTLAFVAVAARSADRPALASPLQHLVDGREDIDQGIGRVGIINDCRNAFLRADGLEPAVDGLLGTKQDEP